MFELKLKAGLGFAVLLCSCGSAQSAVPPPQQAVVSETTTGDGSAAGPEQDKVRKGVPTSSAPSPVEVVLASEVEWNHLNPARGDKAPSAATLWGDRNGTGATGFLLRPSDG